MVRYKASVVHDLKRLDKTQARKFVTKLEQIFGTKPDVGEPLKGEFHGLFKYRIGDYRVIYAKTPDGILVLRIAHRKEVCRKK